MNAVRELYLAATARRRALDHLEDVRRQHVASHDRQIRRRLFNRGLLDEALHAERARSQAALRAVGQVHYPIAGDVLAWHTLHCQHIATVLLIHIHELPQARALGIHHQIVAEQDAERFVAYQVFRHQNGVSQPARRGLTREAQLRHVLDMP